MPLTGAWNYHSTFGTASTFLISTAQQLLAIRCFANGVDGTVQFTPRQATTQGASATDQIKVRAGFGFDWSPSAKTTPMVIAISSSIDIFFEFTSP